MKILLLLNLNLDLPLLRVGDRRDAKSRAPYLGVHTPRVQAIFLFYGSSLNVVRQTKKCVSTDPKET